MRVFIKLQRSMMSSYGFDVNNLDPRTIKIYNNGGKVLSEDFNAAEAFRPAGKCDNCCR